jgi:hypothetical protein
MVEATALKGRVAKAVGRGGSYGALSADTVDILKEAVEEFNLAPDEYIDTLRLPSSVTDLPTLVAYLRTIKDKLSKRDNKVKNEDWDVAKSGELKLYKLFVCCIHAFDNYLSNSPDTSLALKGVAEAAILTGRSSAPASLASKGKTMWEKTFEANQPRTLASMCTLLYLCKETSVAAPVLPPKGPPSPPIGTPVQTSAPPSAAKGSKGTTQSLQSSTATDMKATASA